MRFGAERLEVQRDERPMSHAEVGPPIEKLRARQGHDQDRPLARPLEEMLDEVEQPVVGPLQIFEDEHSRAAVGDPLEERAPCAEQLLARRPIGFVDAEQCTQGRLEPAPLLGVRYELVERHAQLLARRGLVLALSDARAATDHLAQRPERDALAVCRRAALVPVVELRSGQPVEVLLELPHEPALADAGLAGDGHHAQLSFAFRGVNLVLEQAQLLVAAHERWLEALLAAFAAYCARRRAAHATRRPAPACP